MTSKNKTKKSPLGFTLIEMLVVLAIIGTILSIATISIATIRQKSRDIKRLKEIDSVRTALQMYFYNERQFPNSLTFGSALTGSSSSSTYMAILPNNPAPQNDGICPNNDYAYETAATGTSYRLDFCLSTPVGNVSAGEKCATPQGILNTNCCAIPVIYGGQTYSGIKIGAQCWMQQNINIGTMVPGANNQTNNSLIEKYCYNDNPANCNTYGGLYQWNEAMQYSVAEGVQGICPPGWHLPTDAEQHILEAGLSNPIGDSNCSPGRSWAWACNPAGTKLQAGGTSHFEGLLAGRRLFNGLFETPGSYAIFWSSTISGSDALVRQLFTSLSTVARGGDVQASGFSVRCLRN